MLSLSKDGKDSFLISKKIIESGPNAMNVVHGIKMTLREQPRYKDIEFTTSKQEDADKKYVGLRVWRIN